MTQLNVVFA